MIAELGLFCLVLALAVAVCQGLVCWVVPISSRTQILKRTTQMSLISIATSFLILVMAFMDDDFTLLYVANHSNSLLPWFYKMTAVWGGHEGSLLLWVLILSIWTYAFASSKLTQARHHYAVSILGWIMAGFLLLIIAQSNPFLSALPEVIIDGVDLNPLLQDPGFVIHPPILYFGYVGLVIPYAIVMGQLFEQKFDIQVLFTLRRWVLASWGFLTLGIALGSWWAYYELGWGGWWFWDPVENASFMPWLGATALLHVLPIAEKKQTMYGWVCILAIVNFCLSLLGTFLVRSGVLSSVHAFASDDSRGLFLLIFLSVVVILSFGLYFWRAKGWQQPAIAIHSKGGLMFVGSVLFIVALACVLLGTLYPLLYQQLTQGSLSVGPPYFNLVFLPIMALALLILPFAIQMNWAGTHNIKSIIVESLGLAAITWVVAQWIHFNSYFALIYLTLAVLVGYGCLRMVVVRFKQQRSFSSREQTMLIAHGGLAISIIGMIFVSQFQVEKEIQVKVGESYLLADHTIHLEELTTSEGDNYIGTKAIFNVDNKLLFPEKRYYFTQDLALAETAILPGLFRDIYIALGEQISSDQWSARLYYKPLVRWIWLGMLLMMIASFMPMVRKRL